MSIILALALVATFIGVVRGQRVAAARTNSGKLGFALRVVGALIGAYIFDQLQTTAFSATTSALGQGLQAIQMNALPIAVTGTAAAFTTFLIGWCYGYAATLVNARFPAKAAVAPTTETTDTAGADKGTDEQP
jgi:hypothetical protein